MNLVDQFDQLWTGGEAPPDLREFVRQHDSLDGAEVGRLCLLDQYHRWERELAVDIGFYISLCQHISNGDEVQFEILLEEFGYREQRNGEVDVATFAERYPKFTDRLLEELGPGSNQQLGGTNSSNSKNGATSSVRTDGPPPDKIGRYRVASEIGRGAFGVVYQAKDTDLDRNVAIKVPFETYVKRTGVENFLREARVLASLDHPGIVPVYDVGTFDENKVFVVSKLISGHNLTKTDGFKTRDFVGLIAQVAMALHHAHQKSIVHRDIKPANLLVDEEGKPYVVDFGLSKLEGDFRDGKKWIGTPAYMSPEQARGESHRVDGRSDVFSLGVVLYELLTGRTPWQSKSTSDILNEIQTQEVRPPRQITDNLDRELERIILKSLANRASQRYTTALDFAEDLKSWLDRSMDSGSSSIESATDSANRSGDSSVEKVQAVPRGLRSFGNDDAGFFLDLLPGPRDRDGLPDVVRFWVDRVNETNAEATFPVGLVYGPSGCGKSSLVKAGVLPNLESHITTVYTEATVAQTERVLLNKLRSKFPGLGDDLDLQQSLGRLRTDRSLRGKQKLLLVIDQFEQWLNAWDGDSTADMVRSLRQCDGSAVQVILLIRDDFWMAITRFMAELDIPLSQFDNCAGVDLFDRRHARKVLAAFGLAYDALGEKTTSKQKEFLKQAVDSIAVEDKVIPVRLALFAEMVKNRPWEPDTLKMLGGASGIGVAFLDETFGLTAAPQYRLYHQRIRKVLESLLPESGSNIKGAARTRAQLLQDAGLGNDQAAFEDVIRILDKDLRLITPVDTGQRDAGKEAGSAYQLTHDYLVPSIRKWLNQNQRMTLQGRAKIRLRERAADWNQKPDSRRLPSALEYATTRMLVSPKQWTEPQRLMMNKARGFYLKRLWMLLVGIAAVGFVGYEMLGRYRARDLTNKLLSARSNKVESIIAEMEPLGRWMPPTLLARDPVRGEDAVTRQSHLDLALIRFEPERVATIIERLPYVGDDTFELLIGALPRTNEQAKEVAWEKYRDFRGMLPEHRIRLACALAKLDADSENWVEDGEDLGRLLVNTNSSRLAQYVRNLVPVSRHILPTINAAFSNGRADVRGRASLLVSELDQPVEKMVGYLVQAKKEQISPLIQWCDRSKNSSLREQLQSATEEQQARPDKTEEADFNRERALANLSVASLTCGDPKPFLEIISDHENATLRNHAIEKFAHSELGPDIILPLFEGANTVTRRSLVHSLGSSNLQRASQATQHSIRDLLVETMWSTDECGVYSACRWALGRLGIDEAVALSPPKSTTWPDVHGNRYLDEHGEVYLILPPDLAFYATDDEQPVATDAPFSGPLPNQKVLVNINEVSWKKYEEFAQDEEWAKPKERPWDSLIKTDQSTGPAIEISWYAAAAFCNWLSEKEGIPEDQWCYLPNEEGRFDDGMKVPTNVLQRTGYRLPTQSEIRMAMRSGNDDLWLFGNDVELADAFAWGVLNANRMAQKLGTRRPSDWGLFDSIGNVSEWSMAIRNLRTLVPDSQDVAVIDGKTKFPLTGGTYLLHEYFNRTLSDQNRYPRVNEHAQGFRLVRTVEMAVPKAK